MRSKTSFFNKTVFFKNFTRYWPIWALYLVIWTLIMPIVIVNDASWSIGSGLNLRYQILTEASTIGLLGALFGGMAAAALTFSYNFNGRSGSFFASLPIRREGMYLTNYLSGLCWFMVSNIIVFIISALVTASRADFQALCQWFVIVSLHMVIFYSMATFAAMVAGNAAGFLLVYAAMNCGLYICEMLIRLMGTMLLKGITMGGDALTKPVTPVYALWSEISTKYDAAGNMISAEYTGWTALFIYTAVAVVLVILGLLIYRKRHMETASDLISVKWMRPVFKYLFTFFCALVMGYIIHAIVFAGRETANVIPLSICMLMGAFVGYFGSSMMLNKSFRVFKSWPGYIVCALLIMGAMTCVHFDVLGVEKYVPNPEDVKSVTMDSAYSIENEIELTDIGNIEKATKIHKLLIDVDENRGEELAYINFKYHLDNGRTVERQYMYNIKDKTVVTMLDQLLNSPEAVTERVTPKIPINEQTVYYANVDGWDDEKGVYYNFSLTPSQVLEMYETCVLPDVEDGNLGKIDFGDRGDHAAFNLNIELSRDNMTNGGMYREDSFETLNLYVTENAARTWKYLQDNIPPNASYPMY